MTIFPHGGKLKIFILPNGPVRAKFLPRFQFEGKTDVWISQVRRVKLVQQSRQQALRAYYPNI